MLNILKCYLEQTFSTSATFVGEGSNILKFSIEGMNFLAFYNKDDDPAYFKIMLPRVEVILDESKQDIFDKCIKMSSRFKVGKAIILNDAVWLSAEIFLPEKYDGIALFCRMISLLRDMFNQYRNDNE